MDDLLQVRAAPKYFGSSQGFGECELLVRRGGFFEDELFVVRADPRILVTAELLDEVARADSPLASLKDGVLTFNGVNQKVIYRIGEYLMLPDCYVAEWPD